MKNTGRAKDEALFSYGLVLPEFKDDDGTIKSFVWETSIGLEHVNSQDQQKVINELADLLTHGLPGIGKTRAVADVEWLSAPTPTKVPEVPRRRARACGHAPDRVPDDRSPQLNGSLAVHLENAYRDFWNGGLRRCVRAGAATSPGKPCTAAFSPNGRRLRSTSHSWPPSGEAPSC